MAEYSRELIAQAEQRYLRHCLYKYGAQFEDRVSSWWHEEKKAGQVLYLLSVVGIGCLIIPPLRTFGLGLAWFTGGYSCVVSIASLWPEVLACDAHARNCLPEMLGQYAEALVTHPLTLKRLVFSWRQLFKTYGRAIPLLSMAVIGAIIQRYDIAAWLILNTILWVGVSLLRRRVLREHIRFRAKVYLRRHSPLNPNHPRPVLNETAEPVIPGGA